MPRLGILVAIGLSADRLAGLDRVIARWGGMALVGGRFVGLVRWLTPFLAAPRRDPCGASPPSAS